MLPCSGVSRKPGQVFEIVIVISKFLKRYLKAKRTRAPAYIHERCDESKGGFPKGVKRSSGPISRIPEGLTRQYMKWLSATHLIVTHRLFWNRWCNSARRLWECRIKETT